MTGTSIYMVLTTLLTHPSSNLLHPKEEADLQRLIYYCNTCNTSTESDAACTYRQNLNESAQESSGEKAFVSHDATVGDSELAMCTMCGQCLVCSKCGSGKVDDSDEDTSMEDSPS